jgi:hypothetical protein
LYWLNAYTAQMVAGIQPKLEFEGLKALHMVRQRDLER